MIAHKQACRKIRCDLDELDLDLLTKAQERATAEAAARKLGVALSRVTGRYERLTKKLDVHTERRAVEKAVALGLIKRT